MTLGGEAMSDYFRGLAVVVAVSMWTVAAPGWAGVAYNPPPGGWTYTYDGDADAGAADTALDGTWDHDNGSDQWDGTAPGEGAPGGAVARTRVA